MLLYTEDLDSSLRGNIIHFKLLADVTDNTFGHELASFIVEFVGERHPPFFDPPLTTLIQIYKQINVFAWSFPLPEAFDEDVNDSVIVSVDLLDSAPFMTYANNELQIEDISSVDVPTG